MVPAKSSGASGLTLRARNLPAEAFAAAADEDVILRSISQVALVTGCDVSEERKAAMVLALQAAGFTAAQIQLAAQDLSTDVTLDEKLRYGHTITAADFRRSIEGGEGEVSKARLMTHAEAASDAEKRGVAMSAEHYAPVPVDGRDKPMWRRL